jgi:hypothetical protein
MCCHWCTTADPALPVATNSDLRDVPASVVPKSHTQSMFGEYDDTAETKWSQLVSRFQEWKWVALSTVMAAAAPHLSHEECVSHLSEATDALHIVPESSLGHVVLVIRDLLAVVASADGAACSQVLDAVDAVMQAYSQVTTPIFLVRCVSSLLFHPAILLEYVGFPVFVWAFGFVVTGCSSVFALVCPCSQRTVLCPCSHPRLCVCETLGSSTSKCPSNRNVVPVSGHTTRGCHSPDHRLETRCRLDRVLDNVPRDPFSGRGIPALHTVRS